MRLSSLSLFLPAYNEEANIQDSVEKALRVLPLITDRYEVIVIDDGSVDATASVVESIATRDSHVRLVSHAVNRGYGAALKSGFCAAQYDFVFFTDADQQFDLDELPAFVERIADADALIGYRIKRQDAPVRLLNARLWNMANRVLFGLHVRDIDCAFKLFKRESIKAISLNSDGATISAEMLLKLHNKKLSIVEAPVNHFARQKGSATGAKLSVIGKALRELWHLYSVEMGDTIQIQFIKFSTVGIVNATVTVAAYLLLTRFSAFFSSEYLLAEAFAYLAGTVVSFIFNRQWTFQGNAGSTLDEVVRFYATVLGALIVNVIITALIVRGLRGGDIVAVVVAGLCTMLWNFFLFKYWVFTKEEFMRRLSYPASSHIS